LTVDMKIRFYHAMTTRCSVS